MRVNLELKGGGEGEEISASEEKTVFVPSILSRICSYSRARLRTTGSSSVIQSLIKFKIVFWAVAHTNKIQDCFLLYFLQENMSYEDLSPILGFVPIMSPVHLFLNGTWLARSSRLSRHKNSKMAESVGEEVHLTFVDEDDDLVLEKCGKHKQRNWDW